jgi:hypothetical protein
LIVAVIAMASMIAAKMMTVQVGPSRWMSRPSMSGANGTGAQPINATADWTRAMRRSGDLDHPVRDNDGVVQRPHGKDDGKEQPEQERVGGRRDKRDRRARQPQTTAARPGAPT